MAYTLKLQYFLVGKHTESSGFNENGRGWDLFQVRGGKKFRTEDSANTYIRDHCDESGFIVIGITEEFEDNDNGHNEHATVENMLI